MLSSVTEDFGIKTANFLVDLSLMAGGEGLLGKQYQMGPVCSRSESFSHLILSFAWLSSSSRMIFAPLSFLQQQTPVILNTTSSLLNPNNFLLIFHPFHLLTSSLQTIVACRLFPNLRGCYPSSTVRNNPPPSAPV